MCVHLLGSFKALCEALGSQHHVLCVCVCCCVAVAASGRL